VAALSQKDIMTVSTQENQAQEQKPSDKELNFRNLERKLEQERQGRLQAEERALAAEKAAQERSRISPLNEDEDNDDEPYVDHKKLNRKLANFEKNMEQKIDQRAEAKAIQLVEAERRNNYLRENSDFDKVMNSDTVQKFADKHPKLAENILRMPDGFDRQKLVYETIKAMAIDKPEQKQSSIQETIDANRKSPYYQPSGVGSAPYASAGDFSASGQKNAYEKMKELKNRLRL